MPSVPHRTLRGHIRYTSNQPGREGQERGREHWIMTVHGNGHRTLRTTTEIDDPPPVLRDVVYSVDENYQPVDVFNRVTVDDQFVGSGWFVFRNGVVDCESFTAAEGRNHQSDVYDSPIRGLTTHPLQGDAWLTGCYDLSRGPGVQYFEKNFMTSSDHRGATGPLLTTGSSGLEYVGPQEITVEAGTFDSHHFRFVQTSNDHPPYNLWASADGNFILLKAEVTGYMQTAYELVALSEV